VDSEVRSPGAIRDGHVERHRSDLDDVFILEHGSGDLDTVHAGQDLIIEAFQDLLRALIRDPAMRVGDLGQGNAEITCLASANDHLLRGHREDSFPFAVRFHDQTEQAHATPLDVRSLDCPDRGLRDT